MNIQKEDKLRLLEKFRDNIKTQYVLNEIDLRYFERAKIFAKDSELLAVNTTCTNLKNAQKEYDKKFEVIEDIIKETEKEK